MGISFFNKPSYKRFDLPTRYYNEEKSDFERRMKKWEQKNSSSDMEFDKEGFRQDLKRSWSSSRESQSSFNQRYTNFRRMLVLLVITAIIVYLMYWLGNKYLV